MTPCYKILANHNDVTETLSDRLVSLSIHDEIGTTSDQCTLVLDNRSPRIEMPNKETLLDIYLGYKEQGLIYKGQYRVDKIEYAGPPETITIEASAADFKTSFASPKSRTWAEDSLDHVLAMVAQEQGFEAVLHKSLKDLFLPALQQTQESDLHFLTRLSQMTGIVIKPTAGKLLAVPQGQGETASGQPLKPVVITEQHIRRYQFSSNERRSYRAIEARWYDVATGEEHSLQVGSGEPLYRIRSMFADETTARQNAQSHLQGFSQGQTECSLELFGIAEFFAGGRILVKTKDYTHLNGEWSVRSVEHALSSQGYIIKTELSQINKIK